MADQRKRKRPLCLESGQPSSSVQDGVQGFAFRQFAILGRDAAGDLFQLGTIGQVMLDDDEELLQFDRDLDDAAKGS